MTLSNEPASELVAIFRPVAERNVSTYCPPQSPLYKGFVEDAARTFAAEVQSVWGAPGNLENAIALAQDAVARGAFDLSS